MHAPTFILGLGGVPWKPTVTTGIHKNTCNLQTLEQSLYTMETAMVTTKYDELNTLLQWQFPG